MLTPDGFGDVVSWMLCLTSRNRYNFGSEEGEYSVYETLEETQEVAGLSFFDICLHCTRISPVTEADWIFVRASTYSEDECHDQQTDYCYDLKAYSTD
jgi:hypothetical protein